MKIMIVGAGQVGQHLCEKLSNEGQEVVLVDRDESKLRRIERDMNIMTVLGSGASARILAEAGIARTDLFIAVTDSDEVNLVSCIMSQKYNVKKRVARVRNEDFLSPGLASNEEMLGIDLLISPDWAMAEEIAELCRVSEAVDVADFAGGQVVLLGYIVQENNPCAGLSLYQIKELRGSHQFVMVAVIRGQDAIIPRGADIVMPGDKIYLMMRRRDIAAVEQMFHLTSRMLKNIFIVGGGDIGYLVARQLEENQINVSLVEVDKERCEFLSDNLSSTVVLNCDGLEAHNLLEEGIDRADLVIAVTGDDTTNILASLLAKHHGAQKCITKITRPDFIPLLQKLGIDVALSPRQVAASMILRYVRPGAVLAVTTLLETDAEAIELRVPENKRFQDTALKDLAFPKGSIIGAIVRDERVFIPSGETVLRSGDTLIAFVLKEARQKVEEFLTS